jgi:hypothetical protein
VIGTYSSFGIAAPIVVIWNKWRGPGVTLPAAPAPTEKRVDKRLATARR